MAKLTDEMKANIVNAVGIENLNFKYAGVYDLWEESKEPVCHRVLCRGEVTSKKWVWLGKEPQGPYEFESEKQASFVCKGT